MEYNISAYPASFLTLTMVEDDSIITESGAFICSDGAYDVTSKFELKSYKNWIAKLFGGKSLIYKIYKAKESLNLLLSAKDNAEIFKLNVDEFNPIVFEPDLHFARTVGLEVTFHKTDWKSTLNDGIKIKTKGSGTLFLKGYGIIIEKEIDSERGIYVDETALIAYEECLNVKTISKGVKELITSGEGFIFAISGKGKIWLQTREKGSSTGGGGFISELFSAAT